MKKINKIIYLIYGIIIGLFSSVGLIFIFNPCDYGDAYTKRTCLWGDFNIPKKNPVEPVKACSQGSWIQTLGGKSERTKTLRSITPSGFAKAFFEANR